MSYSVRRASLIFTSLSVGRSLINACVLPVLLILLPANEFGLIVLVTPVWWIAQSTFTLGTNEGLGRLVVDRPRGITGGVLVSALATVACAAVATGLLAVSSENVLGIPFQAAALLAVLVGACQAIVSTTCGVLRNSEDLAGATVTLAAAAFLPPVIGLSGIVVASSESAATYLAGTLVGACVAAASGLLRAIFRFGPTLGSGRTLFLAAAALGMPLIPQLVTGLVVDLVARRAVHQFGSDSDLAAYGISAAVVGAVLTAVKSVYLAWTPSYFRTASDQRASTARTFTILILAWSTAAYGVVALLISIASPLIDLVQGTTAGESITKAFVIGGGAALLAVPVLSITNLRLHEGATVSLTFPVLGGAALAIPAGWMLAKHIDWSLAGATATLASIMSLIVMLIAKSSRAGVLDVLRGDPAWYLTLGLITTVVVWLLVSDGHAAVGNVVLLVEAILMLALQLARRARREPRERRRRALTRR